MSSKFKPHNPPILWKRSRCCLISRGWGALYGKVSGICMGLMWAYFRFWYPNGLIFFKILVSLWVQIFGFVGTPLPTSRGRPPPPPPPQTTIFSQIKSCEIKRWWYFPTRSSSWLLILPHKYGNLWYAAVIYGMGTDRFVPGIITIQVINHRPFSQQSYAIMYAYFYMFCEFSCDYICGRWSTHINN